MSAIVGSIMVFIKSFLIFFLLIGTSFANENEFEGGETDPQGCYLSIQDGYDGKNIKAKVASYQCLDGSVAFLSSSAGSYEGKCGQDAAASLIAMNCKMYIDPTILDRYKKDVTPGTLPTTLTAVLNYVYLNSKSMVPKSSCPRGYWVNRSYSDPVVALNEMKKIISSHVANFYRTGTNEEGVFWSKLRNPFSLLIWSDVLKLHWVNVVDIFEDNNQCKAVVNSSILSNIVPCETLLDQASIMGSIHMVSFTSQ